MGMPVCINPTSTLTTESQCWPLHTQGYIEVKALTTRTLSPAIQQNLAHNHVIQITIKMAHLSRNAAAVDNVDDGSAL
jgi:hypothetical protein